MASLADILHNLVNHVLWREESEIVAIREDIANLPSYATEPGVKDAQGETPDFLKNDENPEK